MSKFQRRIKYFLSTLAKSNEKINLKINKLENPESINNILAEQSSTKNKSSI